MARIKIADYDVWYDDETDLVYDEDGVIRSSVPEGAFPFDKKLYTYGTKVKIKTRLGDCYIAEFKKDTDFKRVSEYPDRVIPMKETKEYYDGRSFELDDIFLEMGNGSRKTYLNTFGSLISSNPYDNGIVEVIQAVPYKKEKSQEVETPPVLNGYRTSRVSYPDKPARNTWYDHLFNCEVDYCGDVINWFEPKTFGFEKYVYTVGTKVIIKQRDNHKNRFFVATFDGYNFVIDGYGKPWETLTDNMFKKDHINKGFSIVTIVEPHYYKPEARDTTKLDRFKLNGGSAPVDTFSGTLLYIVVMVVGAIFYARVGIWIFATLVYLLWRFGYLNK